MRRWRPNDLAILVGPQDPASDLAAIRGRVFDITDRVFRAVGKLSFGQPVDLAAAGADVLDMVQQGERCVDALGEEFVRSNAGRELDIFLVASEDLAREFTRLGGDADAGNFPGPPPVSGPINLPAAALMTDEHVPAPDVRVPRASDGGFARAVGIDRAKRVVSRAYAERVAEPGTLKQIHDLERELVEWDARIAERQRANRHANARMVMGRVYTRSIIGLSVALTWSWLNYTEDGYCGGLGWREHFYHSARAAAINKQFCNYEGSLIAFKIASPALIDAVENEHAPVSTRGTTP